MCNSIASLIVATLFAGSAPNYPVIAEDSPAGSYSTQLRSSILVVGSASRTWGPWRFRNISVFIDPQAFTIQNLKTVFRRLSKENTFEDDLQITAFSSRKLAAMESERIAAMRPYPMTPVDSLPDGYSFGPELGPLSARYFRNDLSEYFYYCDSTGEEIFVELMSPEPICGPRGESASDLVVSSIRGCDDHVRQLLDSGIDPSVKGPHGCSALVEASVWGRLGIVKLLLQAGADVNQTNSSGWTPLMSAILTGQHNIVTLLLSSGADLSIRGEDGNNALTVAVLRKNVEAVRSLLARGVDVTARSGDGRTPLEIAVTLKNEEIIQLLKAAGSKR